MANVKILEAKQGIIDEISEKVKNSKSFIAFNYHGLSVADTNELRRILKKSGSEFKIYKNTLVNRALSSQKIDLSDKLNGPKAFAFGSDEIAPIKALADFAKDHKSLTLEVGIVDGEIVDSAKLKELATLPSKEGLLTMFAGGLMEHVRNMAICLDLHSQNLEK
jgi:large subunit ribosomal protein L10